MISCPRRRHLGGGSRLVPTCTPMSSTSATIYHLLRPSECFVHHLLDLVHNRVEVSLIFKALGVDLVDVLRAGGPGGEPAVFGHNLEASDRRVVPWSASQFGCD